jgi:hypothetical protein
LESGDWSEKLRLFDMRAQEMRGMQSTAKAWELDERNDQE